MAEGQFCEEIPYLKWKINDIDSRQMFKSPSFIVKGVKFRAVYHHVISSELYEIYMEPEVGDSMLTIPTYSIAASVSIVSQNKERGDLRFTQQSLSISRNSKGNGLRHVLWLLRKKELLNIRDKIVGGNGMNDVTFLCVFGQRSYYQKDVFEEEGTWCSKQCFFRLGKDLDKLRLIPDSSILLKVDENAIKANAFILSARSETFADKVHKEIVTEKEANIDMEFKCLEHFITYLHSGRLIDSKPPLSVLIQLYEVADAYKVDSLTEMVSFKLLEYINDPISVYCFSLVHKDEFSSGGVQLNDRWSAFAHILGNHKFRLGYAECLEKIASNVLLILRTAASYGDETFKEKIMYSIAKHYDVILHTRKWEKFRNEYSSEFISEVYRVFFQYVKKYRPRR